MSHTLLCVDAKQVVGSKWTKICASLTTFVYWSFYLNLSLMVTAGILRPHSPELLSSLAPDPGSLPWCLRLFSALFHLNIMVGYIETATLIISAGLAILLPLVDLLDFISPPIRREGELPVVNNNWFYRLRLYRDVQLLMCELNQVYGMLIIGAKILLILFAVFCMYGGIRFEGALAMCLAWIGFSTTTYLAMMLNTMGEFREKSDHALRQWKREMADSGPGHGVNMHWLRRTLRSMPVTGINVGSFYFMDKAIVLTIFRIIFDAVTNALLL